MPKPKQFLKESTKKKSSKQVAQAPQTADDYLVAGVDFEEAGEKWRAGDAAKSTRFFLRAIDTYEEALKKFPDSFDLAYNKARVQYELTQYPRLAAQLPGTLLDLLKVALESSRAALSLRQDNADVLFNTAQVLTSLVEALDVERYSTISKEDGLRLLEEAIELFQRCLTLQEYQFAERQAQDEAAALATDSLHDAESGGSTSSLPKASELSNSDEAESAMSQSSQEEQWATIVEPVTHDTLLDTLLAQLETLTTLCSLITADEGRGLAWIEEYSTSLLTQKLPTYVQGTDREEEAALTRATFIAALADANFRSGRMDAATYERALSDAFSPLDLSTDPEGLCDKAEALTDYNSALSLSSQPITAIAASRWKALTAAQDALTAASKLPSAHNLPKIHLLRGDVELLRFQLGQAPTSYDVAARNAPTLLKNAATYYRGAESHAVASKMVDETKEAVVKGALVLALGGDIDRLRTLLKEESAVTLRILEEGVEEGVVNVDWLIQEGIVKG